MQLVINTYGVQVSQRNRCFYIQSKTENRLISPSRVSSILITKAVSLTSSALILAAENDIPVILVNSAGQPVVKTQAVISTGHPKIRKQQYEFIKTSVAIVWLVNLLIEKTEGQISNLTWWANRKPSISAGCNTAATALIASQKSMVQLIGLHKETEKLKASLRGWEGNNARHYWQAFAIMARQEGWPMEGRNYRPAPDAVNATLNYLYGMLYHQVETSLASAGLDAQQALWHRDDYQTPSLSFDMIEPLRPKADKLLSHFIMHKMLKEEWFETADTYGTVLNRQGKNFLIPAFNNWLEEKVKMGGKVTAMKNHILQHAISLRKEIEKTELYEQQ